MKNVVEFKATGRYALFTDPVTKIGGEKCSYHIPTYEALKGIVKSIYWKPTLIWIIDEVRIMKTIKTEAKSVKPLDYGGGNTLAMYTYLSDVEYQVKAHFVWNEFRKDMTADQIDGKHFQIAKRMIEKRGTAKTSFLALESARGTSSHAFLEKAVGLMMTLCVWIMASCSMGSIIPMKQERLMKMANLMTKGNVVFTVDFGSRS